MRDEIDFFYLSKNDFECDLPAEEILIVYQPSWFS